MVVVQRQIIDVKDFDDVKIQIWLSEGVEKIVREKGGRAYILVTKSESGDTVKS